MNDDAREEIAASGGAQAAPRIDAAREVLGAASREKADLYLDEQIIVSRAQARVLGLQAHELERELGLRHWSMLIHHSSGALKLAFEIAFAFIAIVIAVIVGAAISSAAHDRGLIVESFSVPPDLGARGETGVVVAKHVLDRISAMESQTITVRAKSSYQNNWGNDIRVEIPETGISFSEAYRLLVSWLGSQTNITGEVVHTATGYAVTARVGPGAGETFKGPELEPLVDGAAEYIMSATQPYLYAAWLNYAGRQEASTKAFLAIADSSAPASERAWAYAALSGDFQFAGDFARSEEYARNAIRLDPDSVLGWNNLGSLEELRGHDEEALKDYEMMLGLMNGSAGAQIAADALPYLRLNEDASIHAAQGDFASAAALQSHALDDAYSALRRYVTTVALLEYLARAHETDPAREIASRAKAGASPAGFQQKLLILRERADAARAFALDDWRAAAAVLGSVAAKNRGFEFLLIEADSEFAYANARLGDFAAANAQISRVPADCYLCVRMRGNVRAAEKNWGAAAYWFADAIRLGPSLPFAYLDWGRMLLAKGDVDAAIVKFGQAHTKGPHFADPLEMWGEALMQKNRSDLALAKFEDANQYAPNWGRLHLKWGEALYYAGKRDDAWKEFAVASHLDLSSADAAALKGVRAKYHE